VQWDGFFVRLLHPVTGLLLGEHLRQQRGRHPINDQNLPRRIPASKTAATAPRWGG
jgi:hypothetical protein